MKKKNDVSTVIIIITAIITNPRCAHIKRLVCLLGLNLPINNFYRIFINRVKFFSASKKY